MIGFEVPFHVKLLDLNLHPCSSSKKSGSAKLFLIEHSELHDDLYENLKIERGMKLPESVFSLCFDDCSRLAEMLRVSETEKACKANSKKTDTDSLQ